MIGLGFIYWTFNETRRTADAAIAGVIEAGRAADAAKDAIELTTKLERSRINVDSITITITNEPMGLYGIRVSWFVKNRGRSPGFVLKVPLVRALEEPPDVPFYPSVISDNIIYLAQDGGEYTNEFSFEPLVFTGIELAELIAGERKFFCWGKVVYRDGVTSEIHESGFLFSAIITDTTIQTTLVPRGAYWIMT